MALKQAVSSELKNSQGVGIPRHHAAAEVWVGNKASTKAAERVNKVGKEVAVDGLIVNVVVVLFVCCRCLWILFYETNITSRPSQKIHQFPFHTHL